MTDLDTQPNYQHETTRVIFVDFETIHLEPFPGSIWEMAWITGYVEHPVAGVHDGRLHIGHSIRRFIRLTDVALQNAHPVSLAVGGFHERYPIDDGHIDIRDMGAACAQLRAAAHERVWIGAVPDFDVAHLQAQGRWQTTHNYHLVDVENVAAGWLQMLPPWKSSELYEKLFAVQGTPSLPNRAELGEHTAVGDCWKNVQVFAAAYGLTVF